jgi:hypothetical protein
MISALFDLVPRVAALFITTGVVVVLEVLVLVLSARRLRAQQRVRAALLAGSSAEAEVSVPSRALELVAALAPLAAAALIVAAIHTCRRLILQGLSDPSQRENAILMGRGMSGEMHAVMIGFLLAMPVALLAGLAVAFAVSARLRAVGLARAQALAPGAPEREAWARHPGPAVQRLTAVIAAFVVLGLGPVLFTAYRSGSHRILAFGNLAGVEPGLRFELLGQGLAEIADQLKLGLWAGRIGTLIAAALAVKLLVMDAPSRQRARALGRPEGGPGPGQTVLTVVFAVLAAAALVVTRPLQRENETPWPPLSKDSGGPRTQVDTPELVGPDEIDRAPILVVTNERTTLDGVPRRDAELEESLWTLRESFGVLHPRERFNRRLVFLCARTVPRARLQPALAAALRAGYERPLVTFVRGEVTDRPLFGPRKRTLSTAAAVTLVSSPDLAEEGSAVVEDYETCTDLGARLVGLRRQGRDVALVVGK